MNHLSTHTVPSLILAVIFASGILLNKFADLAVGAWLALSICLFVLSLLLFFRRKNLWLSFALILLILTCGAMKHSLDSFIGSIPAVHKPITTVLIGRVKDAVSTYVNRTRFLVKLERIGQWENPDGSSLLVLATVSRQKRDSSGLTLEHGNLVELRGELFRPSDERNPGEFNSRAYYEAQGIQFLIRVRGHTRVTVIDTQYRMTAYSWVMRRVILPVRCYMISQIDSTIGGEEGELIKGLLIGERSGIPYSTRVAFTNSGISHILAVSGSNVVVVVGFFGTLFGLLRVGRSVKLVLICIAVLCYMILTGNQPPIVRATVMTIIVLIGKLLGERTNAFNSLGVAALLILAYDSRQLFDVGFQLSFAAVFSIIYFYPIANSWIVKLHSESLWRRAAIAILRVCAISLVATLGTLPLTAIYFGRVSVVGILTNIFVIPLVGLSVSLGFLSAVLGWMSFWFADIVGAVNSCLLTATLLIAKWSGSLSWAYIDTLRFSPIFSVPFYALLILVFHANRKELSTKLALLFIMSLNLAVILAPSSTKQEAGVLRVSFIDVGQGDAALVEFPDGKTMLIDAGMRNADYDAGERIVVPFIKRKAISILDYVVVSHPDGDHIGGMPAVFRALQVNDVVETNQPSNDPVYNDYLSALQEENSRIHPARADSLVLHIGGATVYVLHPSRIFSATNNSDHMLNTNNASVVVKICYGRTSFLFAGDAEQESEYEMLSRYGHFLRSSVLKVGHHGSRTSSGSEFVEVVKPEYAVISVGMHNKFGHPADEVIERLQSTGASVLRTDEDGALMFQSDGTTLTRIDWK